MANIIIFHHTDNSAILLVIGACGKNVQSPVVTSFGRNLTGYAGGSLLLVDSHLTTQSIHLLFEAGDTQQGKQIGCARRDDAQAN